MENQNATQTEKKGFFLHGRKKKIIIVCIAILLLFNLAARGLGMRGIMGWGYGRLGHGSSVSMGVVNTAVMTKDFESLGVVFAESDGGRRDGYGLTYNALMREAVAKGADGIINVSIAPTSGVFNRTWSGSALAIRYQD